MDPRDGDILFLHGLESGPLGTKAQYLRERWRGAAVDLDTRAAIASRDTAVAAGSPWSVGWDGLEAALTTPLRRAREAVLSQPRRLLIGSSFGGAVLMRLIADAHWQGPSLFLASAGLKLTGITQLPAGHRAIAIHGRHDAVVPIDDSRQLARASGSAVQLWEVGDEHRLQSILHDGTLHAAIRLLLEQNG